VQHRDPNTEHLARVHPVRLPDLDGRGVALSELDGRETLLLFFNPACGHCEAMLPNLRAWEAQPTTKRPVLVVISTGDVETNSALGLSSQILLDADLTVWSELIFPIYCR
jgi:hypothetical protein